MAKFMLVKFSLIAEITDADALRDAALKKFDAADLTTDDYPDTANWHASEEGQEERRQVATQDRDALSQFVDPAKASGLLDGVPGVKAVILGSSVGELEGITQDEARDAFANREGITWWPEARDAELARQHRGGLHSGPARSRLTDAKNSEITTALCTAPRLATLARVRTERRPPGRSSPAPAAGIVRGRSEPVKAVCGRFVGVFSR